MHIHEKIAGWNDELGPGFTTPGSGGNQAIAQAMSRHATSLPHGAQRPASGQVP
ncbi:MAG: hypothetical protein Q7T32_06245 [Moraxellaceae bacterium]|nr:hypothetical protein [Moraxellaceae bacterium]